ncbi:MAG TPA: GTP pyrophosphokinase family protein [Candidatus Onthousia faecipullorum]|uniref:GTP pyrophosphokinase family protein n=1 Tax=Candidatus Onthousia faecipullorum TaxID=2840887 RepID=A0A9D1KBB5_9FIRM|nr:GTP pyrophosphokinase family protein [Candidatus Onthousia faecipullorum]
MEEDKELEGLILKYTAALKSLETQISILLQDYEHKNNYNPVEHIKSRIKSYDSATKKLISRGYEVTAKNIEEYIHDMVGLRIVCSFLSDVYEIVKIIEDSDQITIRDKKDYITNPKDTGYSSYHLLVYVPVYLIDGVHLVEAEIQIRTVAMDFWASLDHKITYKFKGEIPEEIKEGMHKCAEDIHALDQKMLKLNNEMQIIKDDQEII